MRLLSEQRGVARDVNVRLASALLRYRYHLMAVENHLAKQVRTLFKPVFKDIDLLFGDSNPYLLNKLSRARLFQSNTSTAEIPPLTGQSIAAAKQGKPSPISPQGAAAFAVEYQKIIGTRIQPIIDQVIHFIRNVMIDLADTEVRIVLSILKREVPPWLSAHIKGDVSLITNNLLKDILAPEVIQEADNPSKSIRGRQSKMLDQVKQSIESGLVSGRSPKSIANDIKNIVRGQISYASQAGRTAIQRLASQAMSDIYAENIDVIGSEVWMATFDSSTCLLCFSLLGKQYPVGEGPQPEDDTHPNCRCIRVPVTKSWKDLGIDAEEIPPGGERGLTGAAPGGMSFEDWFDDQPESVQKDILGPSRYELWDAGELDLGDFVVNRKVLTLKQLRRKYRLKD